MEPILKIFSEYGWPGIIAIIVVLVIYYLVSRKEKKSIDSMNSGFTSLTNTITSQNEYLVKAITTSNEKTQDRLFNLINKTIASQDEIKAGIHNYSIGKRLTVSEEVDEVLFELLNMTHAQRTVLIEFHNSKENLDGLAFLWYDIQHEKQQKGIDSISAKARNLAATNIRPIIKKVNNSKTHIVYLNPEDIEELYNESTVLYSYFKEINVNHAIYCGIYNYDTNELRGLVAIEFQEGHPYIEELVNEFDIKEKCSVIEHLYNQARREIDDHSQKLRDEK